MWDISKSHSADNETSRILHHVWFSKNVMMVLGTLGVVDKRTRIGKPESRPHPAKRKVFGVLVFFVSFTNLRQISDRALLVTDEAQDTARSILSEWRNRIRGEVRTTSARHGMHNVTTVVYLCWSKPARRTLPKEWEIKPKSGRQRCLHQRSVRRAKRELTSTTFSQTQPSQGPPYRRRATQKVPRAKTYSVNRAVSPITKPRP